MIDVFAGPGGLNEGFSKVKGSDGLPAFDIRGSFEMETQAIQTLKLRSAVRALSDSDALPDVYTRFLNSDLPIQSLLVDDEFGQAFRQAGDHVHQIKLGEDTRHESDELIRKAIKGCKGEFVLIGGPPCQAYSLAGRSRRAHDAAFEDDEKHFLFREYLHILKEHRPAVFVMENVKGLLSATHRGTRMFEQILDDLSLGGLYSIRSLTTPVEAPAPSDFVIRAERYGVPQRRHRVILLGVRDDIEDGRETLDPLDSVSVKEALDGLPAQRSRISRGDSEHNWRDRREDGRQLAMETLRRLGDQEVLAPLRGVPPLASVAMTPTPMKAKLPDWLRPPELTHVRQHEARSHMEKDLIRYSYLAHLNTRGHRPTLRELPDPLMPDHRNSRRADAPFVDRFKVVAKDGPSGTIVSHISKDGHYFIHHDPAQTRSLTVREAARLQTFPDDYFFMGPRTAQYHQVGNAVPPLLAHQIGKIVHRILQ
ncbi:DNA cytosine methyltransferase [Parenemella sanctibonifatiensis]|uniref:DNA (cytosine-5-)-methyltransferase n=1 Tax=Parenemella sanctibonifatiensis TaxID=2016505 RepID=A0A255EBE6_9ACTN|nr:DNA cytosine methyltransferase [Parenemella sanctibonifatiensis]OYN88856.1 DNA (cytosine-5-)-methyltransferase [Parenemella sanctibonifatiensis]